MPFFDGATGRVYYRHWSTPDPRAALVFLHGFGEHTGLYHRYAAELGAHGIDLWALDEIGHGLTEGSRGHFGSLDDLVQNARVLASLAREHGIPLVVGGHSLGSLVAVLTALEEDFRGVVVSGAPLSPLAWLTEAAGETLDLDPEALSSDPFYLDQLETDPSRSPPATSWSCWPPRSRRPGSASTRSCPACGCRCWPCTARTTRSRRSTASGDGRSGCPACGSR
ncbi:alpha/beta fold hydrolase [Paractinoplanes durhamensis]|uniref:alpha/beta fold hydrolase n=1 Tax=Paractinoplanes durhamensis TaxID=113563 RepID=UPI00362E04D7